LDTVLNGVNTHSFRPEVASGDEVRRSLGIPEGAKVIGTIAVFRFQKRLAEWLHVAKDIRERLPETHFIVVGDGPLKESLLSVRRQLGLEDCAHFVGLQTEVRPYLAAFDIYMMSSVF